MRNEDVFDRKRETSFNVIYRKKRSMQMLMGFSDSSDAKESTGNARDLGSVPGSERPTGEGNDYPF